MKKLTNKQWIKHRNDRIPWSLFAHPGQQISKKLYNRIKNGALQENLSKGLIGPLYTKAGKTQKYHAFLSKTNKYYYFGYITMAQYKLL